MAVSEKKKKEKEKLRSRRREQKALEAQQPKPKEPMSKRKKIVLGVVGGVIVVLLGVMAWLFYIGALAPWWAAAKYDGMHYITEQEVEDYIASYQKQQGYEDASDEQWAVFLAYYDLTPEALRESVIQQLVTTEMIEKAADEAGVEITDEEWETYHETLVNNLGVGDEDVYEETIEAQGQTVEEFEAAYRNLLLRERLYATVVEVPEATDEEAVDYIAANYTEETTTKHIYYFALDVEDEDNSYETLQSVQEIWDELVAEGVSVENFEVMVGTYSEDDDLIEVGGAYGWDIDIDDYSTNFQNAVYDTEAGEVSDVFVDDDAYAFVYIDTEFTIPVYDSSDPYELSDFPESLQGYFLDCAAYELWDDDCNEYLASLWENSGCIIYAMPDDAPYNVDMDLAEEYAEEVMAEEESDSEDSDGEDADGDEEGDSDAEDSGEDDSDAAEDEEATDEEDD